MIGNAWSVASQRHQIAAITAQMRARRKDADGNDVSRSANTALVQSFGTSAPAWIADG